jgi:uncharacterized membrane protein YqaE (UPF0057 family)
MYGLLVLTTAYLVRVFLFDGSIGPFEDEHSVIVDDGEIIGHPDIFDRVRALFGAYQRIKKDGTAFWHVRQSRMAVWRCPKCLGFWVSMLINIVYFLLTFMPIMLFPFYVLSIAFLAALLVFAMRVFEKWG